MAVLILLTKVVLIAFYLCVALSLWVPALAQYRDILLIATGVLLVIHVTEYLALKSKMERAEGDKTGHLIPTLIFGFGHWLPLLVKPTGQQKS